MKKNISAAAISDDDSEDVAGGWKWYCICSDKNTGSCLELSNKEANF